LDDQFEQTAPRRRAEAALVRLAVPDLTRCAGIQLNERVSLRLADEFLSSLQSCWIGRRDPDGHAYQPD
jgi:hypothetical protein